MITLALGPGGPFRRLLADFVPFLFGILVGWMTGPFVGVVLGLATGLLAFAGLSALLRWVRRRPRLRLAWRLALLAHVLFWSWQGVRASAIDGPGPVVPGDSAAWSAAGPFRAGTADVAFSLPKHATLGGWGLTPRRINVPAFAGMGVPGGVSLDLMAGREPMFARPVEEGDAIGARAIVLVPEHRAAGPPVAFVRLDLVVSDPDVTEAVLDRVKDLGYVAATLLVSATETHSGVGGYSRVPFVQVLSTDHFDPEVFEAVVDAAANAVREAHVSARPARIAFPRATDRGGDGRHVLARHRPVADPELVDDRVIAMRIEDDSDGHVLAVLLNYAVHPTVFGRNHMAFRQDLAGAIERRVGAEFPGSPPVLFVNGAFGDIAAEGIERDHAYGMDERAALFADVVAADLKRGAAHPTLRVRAARVTRDLGTPHALMTTGDRAAFVDTVAPSAWGSGAVGLLQSVISLPVNAVGWSLGITNVRVGFSFEGAAGGVVNLERLGGRREHAFGALTLEASGGVGPRARLAILWLGGEATQAVGKTWRSRAESLGHEPPMIFGLTNDVLGYVASESEYRAGNYQATSTLFGPKTSDLVSDSLFAALPPSR